MRILLLTALLVIASACGTTEPGVAGPALAVVDQFGPVGYRDPLGVISPDGRQLVTAVTQVIEVRTLPDGPPRRLASGESRVLHLTFGPEGRLISHQPAAGIWWWLHDLETGARVPLWPDAHQLTAASGETVAADRLRELTWSAEGRIAGIERLATGGSRLWITGPGGGSVATSQAELGYPAWLPDGQVVCLAWDGSTQRVTLPCGGPNPAGLDTVQAFGPIGVAPDGSTLYLAIPDDRGYTSVWAWDLTAGSGRVIATGDRDVYAPSVAADGTVIVKEQDYRTEVAVIEADGTGERIRTAFQAETPSWDPTGTRLGVTYGTWRRVVDDFHYPDISQEVGVVAAEGASPADEVDRVIQASPSEDQGMSWSPNGRWIVFHSHQQGSDDLWLRPADAAEPLTRLTPLGRGAEVGWPRWSPDGRWIVVGGDSLVDGRMRGLLWIVGVDQESGTITHPMRRVELEGLGDDVLHGEWLGSSEELVFTAWRPGGVHDLYRVPRDGGNPRLMHSYQSSQRVDGFGASPDGSWMVYPAPDSAGRLQLFRVDTVTGAVPVQLTRDSVQKTQPSVSPDGRRIAFTRWWYRARWKRAGG